jgi:hypothetical protein
MSLNKESVVYAETLPVATNVVLAQEVLPNSGLYPSVQFYESRIDEGAAREFLNLKKWPLGLQNFLLKSITSMPYRFFICDDSGSMAENDGMRMVELSSGVSMVKCSRWAELSETLKYLALLSKALNTPSEFVFLNSANPINIGGQDDNFPLLMNVLDTLSGGGTPLCAKIRFVTDKIRQMEPALRNAGQKVAIIIATDGEASDGDVADALRPLHNLPVWVVIRLCTNQERVVSYWQDIDNNIELQMDVIDDHIGEATEIRRVNPWCARLL